MYLGGKVPCLGSDVGRNPDGDSRRVRPLKRSLLLAPLARSPSLLARYDYAEEDLSVRLMERGQEGRKRILYVGQD